MYHTRDPDRRCRKCDAPVKFFQNEKGNWQIVDAKLFVAEKDDPKQTIVVLNQNNVAKTQRGVKRGDVGYIDHHATCPNADEFRR